jgi:hypothetical protein
MLLNGMFSEMSALRHELFLIRLMILTSRRLGLFVQADIGGGGLGWGLEARRRGIY